MIHLDPTYLRYIYDGLIKGGVHSENESELPEGLIGLYEEAFEEHIPIVQRQNLLKRFALFTILKKEVSAAFVAEILEEREEVTLEFINTYASWFNSPEPGNFKLYHERLKVFVLQKLSEKEIQKIHEKLIARLELAIEEQQADEYEKYALEFLSEYHTVEAMILGDGKKLIDLAFSQTHWQRQLKISNGYTWTKKGLKEVMTWVSKYNDYEVIECGLQMVDLHYKEQNGASQIIDMLSEGDFSSAMKLILTFGTRNYKGEMRRGLLFIITIYRFIIPYTNKEQHLQLLF